MLCNASYKVVKVEIKLCCYIPIFILFRLTLKIKEKRVQDGRLGQNSSPTVERLPKSYV